MQYILTKDEYEKINSDTNSEISKWERRAINAFELLAKAKQYPCASGHGYGYCDGCELEKTDICFHDRHYGK